MACFHESSDGKFVAQETTPARFDDYAREKRQVDFSYSQFDRNHRGFADAFSQYFESSLDRLEKEQPEIMAKDIAAINQELEKKNLLPDFKIVAKEDADGVARDQDGKPAFLTRAEVALQGEQDKAVIAENYDAAVKAFDRFHEGFEGPLNPLAFLNPAHLDYSQVSEVLKRDDLTEQERKGLNVINESYSQMMFASADSSSAINRDDLGQWKTKEQMAIDDKLVRFLRYPSLNHGGLYSSFDWQDKDSCLSQAHRYDYYKMDNYPGALPGRYKQNAL